MIKTLIVDDEEPARRKVKAYLKDNPRFELVGEADCGETALEMIGLLQPDLLLLDIQMPGLNGFDVLRLIKPEERPWIIFATAYDAYAVKAFEVSAADYLLKPFGSKRFAEALAKVDNAANRQDTEVTERVLQHLESPGYATRLPVQRQKRITLLDVNKISRIVVENQILTVYTHDNLRYWSEETLDALVRRLDPKHFFRIHRSSLINLDAAFEIEPWADGRLRLHFGDEVVLTAARGPARELRSRLSF